MKIYLLIKYIKSVLWRVAKYLSYTEEARCLKIKPDNAIRDNEKGNIAYYGDSFVTEEETDKIVKYKDLIIEIQRMWNVKAKVIPVITGATGTIAKSLRQYLSNIPGKHEIKELHKTAVMFTAHCCGKC